MLLRYIAGPLIGSIIGYFTNFIAVKMLFYPRKEVYVFGHRLPLTPGAIPKGKNRLARAIGNAVGEQLLTSEDIRKRLMSDDILGTAAERLLQETQLSAAEITKKLGADDADTEQLCTAIKNILTDEIYASVEKLPIADVMIEKGTAVIKERFAGTMLQMFLNDDVINSVAGPVGNEMEAYIRENARPYIEQEISSKCDALAGMPVDSLIEKIQPDREQLKKVIIAVYTELIDQGLSSMMHSLNIAGMVEEKINAMDIDTLEQLVMSVMKKELNTIVNLGALIGFLLGLINLFF